MNKSLHSLCQKLENEFHLIDEERKSKLKDLSNYISNKINLNEKCNLNVICTHNSRRSHIGQLMLAVAADYYKLENIYTYSGGTEATALNFRVITALEKVGFIISSDDLEKSNPEFKIKWQEEMEAYIAFSKKYAHPLNPQDKYAAIMVCSEADGDCPIVFGSDFRLSLPYEDPKIHDDTKKESESYKMKISEIGREVLYALCLVNKE